MGVRGICIACGLCGGVLRRQGELRGISISPFAPLTPTPLKTSRDTLHPGTGGTSRTIALRGTSGGWGYGECRLRAGTPSASLRSAPPSKREAMSGFKRFYKKYE